MKRAYCLKLAETSFKSCAKIKLPKRDPRCDGAGRYQDMAEGDKSGWGTGHVCQ